LVHSEPSRFPPEFGLLIHCTHLDPAAEDSDRARSLLTRVSDWTSVLSLAQRHGVLSWVSRRLRDLPEATVPPQVAHVLERRSAREAARNERLLNALGGLLDALAACRVDVIPLRCARLIASPGDLVELDLLVRRPDVLATARVLASLGLEAEIPLPLDQARVLVHTHGARRFVHPTGYVVSVQWDVEDRGVLHGPAIDDLWRRACPGKLDGRACLSLERPDLLQLSCVRSTIKRWQRLLWVREIAELMAEADPNELDEALARATASGARHALALGTSLAARLLGAPRPPRLADAADDSSVSALERGVLADLVAVSRPLPGPSDIARFHVRSRERMRDRIGYAVRRATLPRPDDVAALRLPPQLFLLARALALWRRAAHAAIHWMRRSRGARGGKLARFVRTPPHVIDRMLALAGATPDDTVFDLGCGDGAVLIRAAERIGCRGVGVDLDAALIELGRGRARAAGVDRLVELRHGDAREMDLSVPTVVCAYLNASANLTLRPYLQHGLRHGARLVTFNFHMGDWWPDEVEVLDETTWGSNTLYLWRI
jgi:hypothetical protein